MTPGVKNYTSIKVVCGCDGDIVPIMETPLEGEMENDNGVLYCLEGINRLSNISSLLFLGGGRLRIIIRFWCLHWGSLV